MKKYILGSLCIMATTGFVYMLLLTAKHRNVVDKIPNNSPDKLSKKSAPFEQFYFQRSYPDTAFDFVAYNNVLRDVKNEITQSAIEKNSNSANWILEGPNDPGGRINTIAVHPVNNNIMYSGSAAGGIFKTIDGGVNWTAIADDLAYLAISDIVIDPNNSNIIYAATGDHNISGLPHIGDGIYKSTDAGNTWVNIGLRDQSIVSKILIDPSNSNILYAATMGKHYERNTDRGLYKSMDGGATWSSILFLSNQTGVIDLVMDPFDPNTIYASGWDRIRNNQESTASGNGGRIHKTTDGGTTWTQLSGGLPSFSVSRIGLSISQKTPGLLFACVVDSSYNLEGVYKSTNAGANWTLLDTVGLDMNYLGGFGWYFSQIRVSPYNDDEITVIGVESFSSFDGGNTWQKCVPDWFSYVVHADGHDMLYLDSTTVLLATDGGLYRNPSMGNINTWTDIDNIANMQFYRIAVNPHQSGVYAAGAQDNGTWLGNAANLSWTKLLGGDGFQPIFDPLNSNLIYMETQNGNLYYYDGFNINYFNQGIDNTDRRNWDMPIIMSHHSNTVLYTGTYRVYTNMNGINGSWIDISGDLTDGPVFGNNYHNISAVAESPTDPTELYAGTSDGNIWRNSPAAGTWTEITGSLPQRYVTAIEGSPDNQDVVFVSHSGYKDGVYIPHIHKSIDNGTTWIDISGDLPQMGINDVCIKPGHNDSILFVANDAGVYYTTNGGTNWGRLGLGMPTIPVFDIEIDLINNKLIAGTFARSVQSCSLDNLNIITSNNTVMKEMAIEVFPNPTTDYLRVRKLPIGATVDLYDMTGKPMIHTISDQSELQLDLRNLTAGIYMLSIEGRQQKFKIIKK